MERRVTGFPELSVFFSSHGVSKLSQGWDIAPFFPILSTWPSKRHPEDYPEFSYSAGNNSGPCTQIVIKDTVDP